MKQETIFLVVGVGFVILLAMGGGLFFFYDITTKREFVERMRTVAEIIKQRFSIHPLITITQAAHESNFGRSELARRGFNLFGIKANGGWGGRPTYTIERLVYRKYDGWLESTMDWAELISRARIYAESFRYAQAGDLVRFARAICISPFAEDPRYEEKIIRVGREVEKMLA